MFIMFIALVTFFILVLCFSIEGLFRVNKFSKYMYEQIDYAYDNNGPWPDVYKSWDNLKWYKIFNYNFSDFIVYKTG